MNNDQRPLRVAFYGGMANNCYMVCKRMRELGVDGVYIRDHLDNYAISQPMWEDWRFRLSYQDVAASGLWKADKWDEMARDLGWQQPHWIVDPVNLTESREIDARLLRGIDMRQFELTPTDTFRKIVAYFQEFDLIFTSASYAVVLAYLSGRPFVICPAGGEFLVATGQLPTTEASRGFYAEQGKLVRAAFGKTRAILTNTQYFQHTSLTGGLFNLVRHFRPGKFQRVSMPFVPGEMLDAATRRTRLNALLQEMGSAPIPQRFSMFVPSRVDWQWKGQDRLMAAIDAEPSSSEFCFVFTGWGVDLEALREWAKGRDNIRMLDAALSKPLLCEFYAASDIVFDQITLGHVGTAAREAACFGTPVIAHIAPPPVWAKRQQRPELPVLEVETDADIATLMRHVADGTTDLETAGRAGIDWIREYSSPELMRDALVAAAGRPGPERY